MKNKFSILLFVLAATIVFSCKNKEAAEAQVDAAAEVAEAQGMTYEVNTEMSKVMWVGSKPTGQHNGTINVSEGSVAVKDGNITGGTFTLDMNSITVLDQEGDQKSNLEAHLKGTAEGKEDHFFNVAQYPTATFEVTKLSNLEGNEEANMLVYGNLTMRGVTKQIGFPAMVSVGDAGVKVKTPSFTLNRTDWGVNYGSKSVFDNLKDNFINDEIELTVYLTTGS